MLLSVSAHADAALTVADWRAPGDGLIVRDLATGYESTFPRRRDLEAEVDDPGLIALLSAFGPTFTLTPDYGLPKGPFVMSGVGVRYGIGSVSYAGLMLLSRAT
jgi:hypothetical protein